MNNFDVQILRFNFTKMQLKLKMLNPRLLVSVTFSHMSLENKCQSLILQKNVLKFGEWYAKCLN